MNGNKQYHLHAQDEMRDVICLDLSGLFRHDIEQFNFNGWQFTYLTSTADASAKIKQDHILVGLVCLRQLNSAQLDKIFQLTQSERETSWIALVTAEDLRDANYCDLIYDNFFDFFTLPIENKLEYLRATLGHAYGLSQLKTDVDQLHEGIRITEMVGSSRAMQEVFRLIRKVAEVDAPVLITGETGTGKEMVARAIHQRSHRSKGPYVAINCGALPESLIHAELFGHEKGAFTGAHQRNIGHLEAAQSGSIFLDEIGCLPLDLQVYLLRFLEEHTIQRLGSSQDQMIDSRVIAATNVDLEAAVRDGKFREDLFYRLNVVNVIVPPLRDRAEDIGLLANYFMQLFSKEHGIAPRKFAKQAISAMNSYRWPGNVRELINRIRRSLIMSEGRLITACDLGFNPGSVVEDVFSLDEVREQAEKKEIRKALRQTGGKISKAAEMLSISRVTLYRLIEKYNLR